ncbi:MAG: hypothetical protein H6990_11135 [Pseudomonadales bacterium]|nr:hypothetical protein [Pseudomonadales bacterium]
MHIYRVRGPLAVLLAGMLAAGCGAGEEIASESFATGDQKASVGLMPCELLSPEEVASVLPAAGAGTTTQSGGSLIEGVDAYQCSYLNATADLLTVILNVAADDQRFDQIAPGSELREERQPVQIGEGGWMSVAPGEVKITAIQNRTVIDIDLMTSDAADRTAQLILLTESVAAKLE